MFGLERIGITPKIAVRDYKPNRVSITLSFKSEANEIIGIPRVDIPEQDIWTPGNIVKSQTFLTAFLNRLDEIPEARELASSISIHKEEKLFFGEVSYETVENELKITSIEELKSELEPNDLKAEDTLPNGKLFFKVSYIIPNIGEPFVEIYVLTLHPEMRVKLGEFLRLKLEEV